MHLGTDTAVYHNECRLFVCLFVGWSGEDTRLGTQQTLAQRAAYLCVGEWVGQVKIHGWVHSRL